MKNERKFKPGDRVRAITGEEGNAYDGRFQNKLGTIVGDCGDDLYDIDFDEILPPSGKDSHWRGRGGGIVLVELDDAGLEPLRLEFELACAIGKLVKEAA
jgi:hypothetical protein